jgi:hypothetical protein
MKNKIILVFVLFNSSFSFSQEKKPVLATSNKIDTNEVYPDSSQQIELSTKSKINVDKRMSKTKNKPNIDNKPVLSIDSSLND